MNNFLYKQLIPSILRQWNQKLLLRFPIISTSKAIFLIWVLLIFWGVSIACSFLVSLEIWNSAKNDSKILLELGIGLLALFVWIQWYNGQAKYSRFEAGYFEKIIIYFMEVGMLCICLAIPTSYTYLLNSKTSDTIVEENLAEDMAALMFLNAHAWSIKNISIGTQDQIDAGLLNENVYVDGSSKLDSLVNKYYSQLNDVYYKLNTDREAFFKTTGLILCSKYKVTYNSKMLKQIEVKIQSTYVSMYSRKPWENPILRWIFLGLIIFPQIALYAKIKQFFSTLGQLIIGFILINTILVTFLYVFSLGYNSAFMFKVELILFVVIVSILLIFSYRKKQRNQFVLKAIISLHIGAFIGSLYLFERFNVFLLLCLGLILALFFEHIYRSIVSLPGITVKMGPETTRLKNTTKKKNSPEILPTMNKMITGYKSFNKSFYQKNPFLYDLKIIPAVLIMSVVGISGFILARILKFDVNDLLKQFFLIGDPFALMAFYLSLIPLIIWAIYFHKKKIDLTNYNKVLVRTLIIWSTIFLISSGFFLSMYSYHYVRYSQLIGQTSETVLKKEVKNLLALFDFGNKANKTLGKSLPENWAWLQKRFDYLEKQLPNQTTVLQNLQLEKFSYTVSELEQNIPLLFHKYGITAHPENTLANILERETLEHDLENIINLLDVKIRLHYFKNERLASFYEIFVVLAVISMMLFLGKTLPIKTMGWMYFLPFGIPLILNYPTGFETWNLFNYPLAIAIFGVLLLTSIRNFKNKNKPGFLFSYGLLFLLLLDLGYKVLPLLLAKDFLNSFTLAIMFTALWLWMHTVMLKKIIVLPYNVS